jgi:hypothetical protein
MMELADFGVPALLRPIAAMVEERWTKTDDDLPGAEAQKQEAVRRLLDLSEWFHKIS